MSVSPTVGSAEPLIYPFNNAITLSTIEHLPNVICLSYKCFTGRSSTVTPEVVKSSPIVVTFGTAFT